MNHRHYMEVLPGGHCYRCHMSYDYYGDLHRNLCPAKDKEPTPNTCPDCMEGGKWGKKPACPLCGK